MVKASDLTKEITKALRDFTDDVNDAVSEAADDVTKQGVKLLKSKSPKLTGSYRKGWGRAKTDNGYVIRNRTDYQLTHLLEYGHAKRGGGRVRAYPHIRPVEEQTVKEFEDRVEKAIKR